MVCRRPDAAPALPNPVTRTGSREEVGCSSAHWLPPVTPHILRQRESWLSPSLNSATTGSVRRRLGGRLATANVPGEVRSPEPDNNPLSSFQIVRHLCRARVALRHPSGLPLLRGGILILVTLAPQLLVRACCIRVSELVAVHAAEVATRAAVPLAVGLPPISGSGKSGRVRRPCRQAASSGTRARVATARALCWSARRRCT